MQAVLWSIASAFTFLISSAAAKFLGQGLPTAELTFFRAAAGVVLIAGVWRFVGDLGKARDPWGHVIRCGLGVISSYGLMYAFATIPLALASLLFVSRVLLLPMTARWMLGERSAPTVWAAVILGFVGVVVASWPKLQEPESQLGVLAALVAAVASAGSQTAVRRLVATNSAGLIVLIYTAVALVATAPVAALDWVTPPVADWPVLAVLGLFAVLAQLTAAKAFAKATVGFLAPLDLLGIPIGAALGWMLFGEVPSVHVWIGGGLVLVAAAVVTRRG